MKHTGLLSSGFARLPHYFTPFQAFVVSRTEQEGLRFNVETVLLVLEREAQYRAGEPTPAGLFVYQFETLCRNRLGYERGLVSMAGDPFYDRHWKEYIDLVRLQAGVVDFADLVYVRSQWYVLEKRRPEPDYEPSCAGAVRREGGEDRQGELRPRPAVPVRGACSGNSATPRCRAPGRATTCRARSRRSRRSCSRWNSG